MNSSSDRIRTAAILSTGSEILQGLYPDTNAQFLASQLTELGVPVAAIAAAPDDVDQLEATLRYLLSRADLVLCTGGLGPTEDDLNRYVIARVFGTQLVRDAKAIAMMEERFAARGRGMMTVNNLIQADIPAEAEILYNKWGTAPGFFLQGKDGKFICAMPGPPSEMRPMFAEVARPLVLRYLAAGSRGVTRTVHTFGLSESYVNSRVADCFHDNAELEFTILAKPYGVDIRMAARGTDPNVLQGLLDQFEHRVRERIEPAALYGVDYDTMASATAKLLLQRKVTVAAAESCTGGLIAKMLTDLAGSSAYLGESYVTYSNEGKQRLLGVREATLKQFGAVSAETATEMAEGARKASGADCALAVTGIAGPGGGSNSKPVGLTYIGLATPSRTVVEKQQFIGDRDQNRLNAALNALNLLRRELLGVADPGETGTLAPPKG